MGRAAVVLIGLLVALNHLAGRLLYPPVVFWLVPLLLMALQCGLPLGVFLAVVAAGAQIVESVYFRALAPAGFSFVGLFGYVSAFTIVAYLAFSLQRASDRLRDLQLLRDNLTHFLVHDLKQPLTSAGMALNLLRQAGQAQEGLGPKELHLIDVTEQSLDQLGEMMGQILTIATAEAGELRPDLSDADLSTLVAGAVSEVRPRAADQDLALVEHLEGPLPARVDRARLQRVVWNLLDNAFKFTPRGGQVTVAAEGQGAQAEITVSDTGPGIPPELQRSLFSKFAQGREARAPQPRSAGLGLYYSKLVVEAHGGRIWVESAPDRGTTVHFTLPLSPTEGVPPR